MTTAYDAYVTRTELVLGNLDLMDATYQLEGDMGLDFGQVAWKREMVRSPYVHGPIPVTQTKDAAQISLTVQVRASSQNNLRTAIQTLLNAFYQWEYELRVTYDAIPYAWRCWSADAAVGATDDRFDGLNVPVKLIIPRSPIPIAGPF